MIADGDSSYCHTNNSSILCHTLWDISHGSISQVVKFFRRKWRSFFFVTHLYNLQMFLDPSLLSNHKPLEIFVFHPQRNSNNNTHMSRLYGQAKMLCHAAEHLVYTFVPPRLIPTPDSVVYNDSIFNRDSQGSYVRTIFSLFAAEIHVDSCIC